MGDHVRLNCIINVDSFVAAADSVVVVVVVRVSWTRNRSGAGFSGAVDGSKLCERGVHSDFSILMWWFDDDI